MSLKDLGWTDEVEGHLQSGKDMSLIPGRVANVSGKRYRVITEADEFAATLDRGLAGPDADRSDLPAVGAGK